MTEEQTDLLGKPENADDGDELEKLGPLDDTVLDQAHHWPKDLIELLEHATTALVKLGYPLPEAKRIAQRVLTALAFCHGGRIFYLPKGAKLKSALRDKAIYDQFDGGNHRALARRYQLTETHIYRIVKRQTQLHRDRDRGARSD